MQQQNRVHDWPEQLHLLMSSFDAQPFVWGAHDCCTFAADAVFCITGIDRMASYRGGYKTAAGAARKLRAAGGLEAAITAELGDPIPLLMAQRGDVVCFTSPLGDTAGVCMGTSIAAAGLAGITYTPISQAFKAWRV